MFRLSILVGTFLISQLYQSNIIHVGLSSYYVFKHVLRTCISFVPLAFFLPLIIKSKLQSETPQSVDLTEWWNGLFHFLCFACIHLVGMSATKPASPLGYPGNLVRRACGHPVGFKQDLSKGGGASRSFDKENSRTALNSNCLVVYTSFQWPSIKKDTCKNCSFLRWDLEV